jgi:hypothetical protein
MVDHYFGTGREMRAHGASRGDILDLFEDELPREERVGRGGQLPNHRRDVGERAAGADPLRLDREPALDFVPVDMPAVDLVQLLDRGDAVVGVLVAGARNLRQDLVPLVRRGLAAPLVRLDPERQLGADLSFS